MNVGADLKTFDGLPLCPWLCDRVFVFFLIVDVFADRMNPDNDGK
jgi:hypothetical protein